MSRERSQQMFDRIAPYIRREDRILDIGWGLGTVDEILTQHGYTVYSLDVQNYGLLDPAHRVIYDGERMPFANDTFDVALLITILHHTPDPARVLMETKRVARRIIIFEDIYETRFQKYLTYWMDNLTNGEFQDHPHTNKTDAQWLELYAALGFDVAAHRTNRWFKVFKNGLYVLERRADDRPQMAERG